MNFALIKEAMQLGYDLLAAMKELTAELKHARETASTTR